MEKTTRLEMVGGPFCGSTIRVTDCLLNLNKKHKWVIMKSKGRSYYYLVEPNKKKAVHNFHPSNMEGINRAEQDCIQKRAKRQEEQEAGNNPHNNSDNSDSSNGNDDNNNSKGEN